jgi:hypothetical protein
MAQLVEALHYKLSGRRIVFRWGHLDFSLTLSFGSYYGHDVESAYIRNGYHEYLLGVKGRQCVVLQTMPHSCADFIEILGASNPCSRKDLSTRPVEGLLYLMTKI